MNPARSLGPALMSWTWTAQWVYIVGPLLGAVAGASVYRWLREASQTIGGDLSHEPVHQEEENEQA